MEFTVALQPREIRILEELMREEGKVVTRTMLLERVWNYHFDPQTDIVDIHISPSSVQAERRRQAGPDRDHSRSGIPHGWRCIAGGQARPTGSLLPTLVSCCWAWAMLGGSCLHSNAYCLHQAARRDDCGRDPHARRRISRGRPRRAGRGDRRTGSIAVASTADVCSLRTRWATPLRYASRRGRPPLACTTCSSSTREKVPTPGAAWPSTSRRANDYWWPPIGNGSSGSTEPCSSIRGSLRGRMPTRFHQRDRAREISSASFPVHQRNGGSHHWRRHSRANARQ